MTFKELREKYGLTQSECAEILGVSRRTYQYLESNNSNITSSKFKAYYEKMEEKLSPQKFHTNVLVGKELLKLNSTVKNYKKRYCYEYLKDFIDNNYFGKVCILYGLRRTGKTTLLFQLLGDVDINKTAYIKVNELNNMAQLVEDIRALNKDGFINIFIDEVTLLSDFINTAATLSDVYSMLGMKIILSGTDSLGFMFAGNDELFDRNIMIHTSFIPFKEFSYILDINDIDTYIEYGGTLKKENISFDDPAYKQDDIAFKDDEATRKYIDTAISRNIQRSLKNYSFGNNFIHLKELYEANELTNVINRIVENMNHEFLLSVINDKFNSSDLGSSKQLLLHSNIENVDTALYKIDKEKVLELLKEIIDVKEKEDRIIDVKIEALKQVKTYLYMLDLIADISYVYDDRTKENKIIFTQPGMRYSITKALVYSLLQDKYFNTLTNVEKDYIINKILSDVKGRMMEDIILYETSLILGKNNVFKYKAIAGGEIDMVCYNKEDNTFNVYEIKHSDKIAYESQTKFLHNEHLINSLEEIYGKLKNRYVLYNGENKIVEDVNYLSAQEYLNELRK